ncbi:hypothetical protein [Paraburkholderia sp. BR10882]|uniref:hypothetical protein n=1 Tax=unclassified Paraburkholderia TaxID=2615204 RepID=UPI0034CFDA94
MATLHPGLPELNLPSRQGGSPSVSSWLLSYPMFRDALQREETDFVALPSYVRLPVLRRMAESTDASSARWTDLGGVRASYIELCTSCVADVVRDHLSAGANKPATAGEAADELETLCSIFPAARVPLVARPPCLLSPGVGFFLEGWARFLAYWSRNDRTIPLLAVDWQALYGRLTDDLPGGAKAAAKVRQSLFCIA